MTRETIPRPTRERSDPRCTPPPSLLWSPPPLAPATELTVPEPTVTSIRARFANTGFSPQETVALLASHTIATADVVGPTIPGTPFDSTVGTVDSQIFLEVLLKGTSFPGNGSQPGAVLSPFHGEMRLQSDFLIARDPRTACFWQEKIDNQALMVAEFKAALSKLQVLCQKNLIDCRSDVVSVSKTFTGPINFPARFSRKDVDISCPELLFPSLATVAGPASTIHPIPGY